MYNDNVHCAPFVQIVFRATKILIADDQIAWLSDYLGLIKR